MIKQQAITETPKHLRLPLWKRLILITVLFLSAGPLVAIASTPAAYASTANPLQHTHSNQKEQSLLNIVIVCKPGNGGEGGKATQKSSGASGGGGGNCTVTIPIKLLLTIKNNMLHASNTNLRPGVTISPSALSLW